MAGMILSGQVFAKIAGSSSRAKAGEECDIRLFAPECEGWHGALVKTVTISSAVPILVDHGQILVGKKWLTGQEMEDFCRSVGHSCYSELAEFCEKSLGGLPHFAKVITWK